MEISETYLFLGIYNYLVTAFKMQFSLVRIHDVKNICNYVKKNLENNEEYEFEIIEDLKQNKKLLEKCICSNEKYIAAYDVEELNCLIEKNAPEYKEIINDVMNDLIDSLYKHLKNIAKENDENTLHQIFELKNYYATLQNLYNISIVNESQGNKNDQFIALARLNIERRNKLIKEICIDCLAYNYIKKIVPYKYSKYHEDIDLKDENAYLGRMLNDVELFRAVVVLEKSKVYGNRKQIHNIEYNFINYEDILVKRYSKLIEILDIESIKNLKYYSTSIKHNMIFNDFVMESAFYNSGKYNLYANSDCCIDKKIKADLNYKKDELIEELENTIDYLISITNKNIKKNPDIYSEMMELLITIIAMTNNSEELNLFVHKLVKDRKRKLNFRRTIVSNLLTSIDDIEKGCNKNYKKVKKLKPQRFLTFDCCENKL